MESPYKRVPSVEYSWEGEGGKENEQIGWYRLEQNFRTTTNLAHGV